MDSTDSKKIRIAFLGDLHLGSRRVTLEDDLLTLLHGCDHVVVNLEGPICEPSLNHLPKAPILRSDPGTETVLKDWHITCATLANNHIFDYGLDGFRNTCQVLQEQQIFFAGAGKNINDASRPLILDCNGYHVGIIPCTESITGAVIATEDTAGCNDLQFPQIVDQILKMKALVDVVIVTPHWDFLDYTYPSPTVISTGRRLFDGGADIIIGHHSHVAQGVCQEDDGREVIYSLGNFYFETYESNGRIFDASDEIWDGIITIVELQSNRKPQTWPVYIRQSNGIVNVDNSKKREIQWRKRSAPLKLGEKYAGFWRRVTFLRLLRRICYWLHPSKWWHIRRATLRAGFITITQSSRILSRKAK
jgi:hypothetical protein